MLEPLLEEVRDRTAESREFTDRVSDAPAKILAGIVLGSWLR